MESDTRRPIIKGSVGELKEAIQALQKDSDKHGDKLISLSHQIYAAWDVTVVVLNVTGFLIKKFWDSPVHIAEEASKH